MKIATHMITLPLPGYPHPDAKVELPAMQIRPGLYMTGSNTLRFDAELISVREV